jgi:acyl carrier protein
MTMSVEAFVQTFVLQVDGFVDVDIAAETPLSNFKQWDSLAILAVLAWVEADFGVMLSGADVRECATLGALFEKICRKKKHMHESS